MQRREGVKVGCNGKDIYGWYSCVKRRTGLTRVCNMVAKILETMYSNFSLGVVFLMCIFVNCSCLAYIVVSLRVLVVLCVYCCSYLDAGLLARSQYPEGAATGHLDTGFAWFPCVYKGMLRWFPRLQVATTCFSCSPPDLNFLVTFFSYFVHVK